MILYKLTDRNGYTTNNTKWEVGKTVSIDPSIKGCQLCTNQVLHAYTSLLLAELMGATHGNYGEDKLIFEVDGDVVVTDGTKVGCKSLKVIRIIYDKIKLTKVNRVAFGILCSLEVYKNKKYALWANNWLDNIDRSAHTAAAAHAAHAAYVAVYAAHAAYAAVSAAYADAAAYAAAADAAAYAAVYAAKNGVIINFQALAEKALTYV